MTLSFTQTINGEPNYFIEKIWTGLPWDLSPGYYDFTDEHFQKFKKRWDGETTEDFDQPVLPKIHTIRKDPFERWKAGRDIHFVVHNRSSDRFQFAPIIKCVSIQTIVIEPKIDTRSHWRPLRVIIDGSFLDTGQISELATNDGFTSVEEFAAYFKRDFTGKIIHWTSKRY